MARPLVRLPGCGGSAGVLLAGIVSLSGCGAQNGFNGQAVKNYSLTVTATSGQIAHSFDVNLNLQ